jgi:multidrug efflux pump subunit AcrB
MPSMIGLIMLMGIATKNSILLIDYVILARREHGLDRWHALLDACRKRARPIVMTTVAMGAGMLPIAIGLGTDPSFRAPMAIVVIGGLITSTFLSLLVIPVVFTFVDDAGRPWKTSNFRNCSAGPACASSVSSRPVTGVRPASGTTSPAANGCC